MATLQSGRKLVSAHRAGDPEQAGAKQGDRRRLRRYGGGSGRGYRGPRGCVWREASSDCVTPATSVNGVGAKETARALVLAAERPALVADQIRHGKAKVVGASRGKRSH